MCCSGCHRLQNGTHHGGTKLFGKMIKCSNQNASKRCRYTLTHYRIENANVTWSVHVIYTLPNLYVYPEYARVNNFWIPFDLCDTLSHINQVVNALLYRARAPAEICVFLVHSALMLMFTDDPIIFLYVTCVHLALQRRKSEQDTKHVKWFQNTSNISINAISTRIQPNERYFFAQTVWI